MRNLEQVREILEEGDIAVILKDDGTRSAIRAIQPNGKLLRTRFEADSLEAAIKSKDFMHGKANYLNELGDRVLEIVAHPVVASEPTHSVTIDGKTVEISDESLAAFKKLFKE